MPYYFFTESHILEDVNKCVFSQQEGDADTLDRTAGAIRGRSARVCNVVSAEMDNYEPGAYTDRVMEAVVLLRDQGKNSHSHDSGYLHYSPDRKWELFQTQRDTRHFTYFTSPI